MKATSIILAGGKNLRLGRIKALEIIGGKSLIERVIERLTPISSRILIVTSLEHSDFPAGGDVEILTDLYPGQGPLVGIYTGLMASRSSHSIVVACDMPFLNTELLDHMLGQTTDYDAVVPRLETGLIEPLHAVYSRNCLEKMKERVERGQLAVESLIETLRVKYVQQEEICRLDPDLLSFFNINYQSDIDRALALADEDKG